MSVFEVRGGPINRRYLDRKTKHEISDMYMTLLDAFTKMEERARIAEQEKAELAQAAQRVMDMLEEHGPGIVPHLMDTDENAGQRLRDILAKHEQEK